MGPYCKFCGQRCFVHVPAETPKHILEAYGKNTIAATCPKGQELEKLCLGYCWADIQAAVKAEQERHTPGPLEIRIGYDATGYPTFAIAGMSGPDKIDVDLLDGYRRMLEASANSYARHCGWRAVECAEEDLLGELLEACKRLLASLEDLPASLTGARPALAAITRDRINNACDILAKAEGTAPQASAEPSEDRPEPSDPSDMVTCYVCGRRISDAEHDDNGGKCEECAYEDQC